MSETIAWLAAEAERNPPGDTEHELNAKGVIDELTGVVLEESQNPHF